jgi:hypothetical protein
VEKNVKENILIDCERGIEIYLVLKEAAAALQESS